MPDKQRSMIEQHIEKAEKIVAKGVINQKEVATKLGISAPLLSRHVKKHYGNWPDFIRCVLLSR